MIKLGQFFASRVDILPKEIIDVLAGLQDEVPPENFDDIRAVLESEFNRPIGEASDRLISRSRPLRWGRRIGWC